MCQSDRHRRPLFANMAQCARLNQQLSASIAPFNQNKCRHLRVSNNREATNVGDIRRRYVYCSIEFFNMVGGSIHVVHADITDPLWRRAVHLCVLRQID